MMRILLLISTALLLAACGRGATPSQKAAAAMSPEPARGVPAGALIDPDFEQSSADGGVPGWNESQHAGPRSYRMWIDPVDPYAGHGSFHMARTLPQVYGSLTQTVDARPYAGKTIELSAMVKSKDVGPGGWKLFVDAGLPNTLVYSTGLTGDNGWKSESLRLKVPAIAERLVVGVTLLDAGDGWMDNVELKTVD